LNIRPAIQKRVRLDEYSTAEKTAGQRKCGVPSTNPSEVDDSAASDLMRGVAQISVDQPALVGVDDDLGPVAQPELCQ